jgi:glycerol-3-phosphate O-acyltransferase / dihydroxyacetone phosphate acyltransferase
MRTYFRLQVEGETIPQTGSVLLVANHPNSLLDPALVAAVARRPVRFLAKATLFPIPVIGWLVRGAGAIPVHRRQDDASRMDQNTDAFEAAYAALGEGAAIGIFPEGVSHDEPALAPLRTGAARIALEVGRRTGRSMPIIPVGLVFREKEIFRSDALVVVGGPVAWDDLAEGGPTPAAVRELTARIDGALRRLTVNLESWEDAPLVEYAYAIYAAEFGGEATAAERLARIRAGTKRLAELRRSGDERWRALARDVLRHRRILRHIRLRPGDLRAHTGFTDLALRTGRLVPFLTGLAVFGGAVGTLLFWPPYKLVEVTERISRPQNYVRSTTKVLAGAFFFALWILAIALLVGSRFGWLEGAVVGALLPFAAIATVLFNERWRQSRDELRTYFVRRRRKERIVELARRQRAMANAIRELVERPRSLAEGAST